MLCLNAAVNVLFIEFFLILTLNVDDMINLVCASSDTIDGEKLFKSDPRIA